VTGKYIIDNLGNGVLLHSPSDYVKFFYDSVSITVLDLSDRGQQIYNIT
jgi:hypothetical protein